LGTVVDEQGMPLSKVEVSIKELGITKKTTDKGNFEFKNLESQVYEVTFKKAGYADTVVKVAVTATERTKIGVTMKVDLNNPLRIAS